MGERILVCGGRDFGSLTANDRAQFCMTFAVARVQREIGLFEKVMNKAAAKYDIEAIIQGGAKGADRLAKTWALRIPWIESIDCPADWNTHGKKAGILRNQSMLDLHNPTLVIAFPGGVGTQDMITRSRKAGIKVIEVKL